MQKRTILSVTLITALLVAAFLLLNSAAPVEKKETPLNTYLLQAEDERMR